MSQIINGTAGNDTLIGTNPGDPANPDGLDTINGLAGDDTIHGGAGADIIDGGDGIDDADYSGSAAVTIDLQAGTATGGDAEGDTLTSIENLSGSAFNDILSGNAAANAIDGGDGADRLSGADGIDSLNGGAGDDILQGGAGADALIGGDGNDTADYSGSATGITVNLDGGIAHGGDAEGDTFASIENLIGSDADDTLTGDAGANTLQGGAGADHLVGGAGLVSVSKGG